MGGYSSGRRGGKRTTDDMHILDIRKIQRAGLLVPGRSFGWQWSRNGEKTASIDLRTDCDAPLSQVTLNYRTRPRGGEWKDMKYPVHVTWTDCNYGGQRAWWLCPARGCGRRVAVLFGGSVYACRHCQELAYSSQREQAHDRASSRAETIRKRLGWIPGILHGEGGKPKGMHWTTFMRLQATHNALVIQSLEGMSAKLGLVMDRLAGIKTRLAESDPKGSGGYSLMPLTPDKSKEQ